MLHFLAKRKHPFCSQYSLISDVSDVMLMMLLRPKFVGILINQNKINRTIFLTINQLFNQSIVIFHITIMTPLHFKDLRNLICYRTVN